MVCDLHGEFSHLYSYCFHSAKEFKKKNAAMVISFTNISTVLGGRYRI